MGESKLPFNYRLRDAKKRTLPLLMLLLSGSFLIGCSGGGGTTKAGGIVKYDGKPLTRGTLEFYPVGGGRTANATIEEDGTFVLSYRKPGDGLPPGEYKVAIIATKRLEKSSKKGKVVDQDGDEGFMGTPGERFVNVVPTIYNSIRSTPHRETIVDDGSTQYIEIDIPKRGK